jgi:DNA repair exonuclease SbcCD ATPase subunit
MKFKLLEIENFLSYKKATLSLSDRGLVLIEGRKNKIKTQSNGTGKTSLIEAIIWCLFGQTMKPLFADDVVHNYEKDCRVSLTIENFKVTRYRKHKKFKNSIHLEINGKDRRGVSEKATQEKICNLLGSTFESFVHSVFLSSEDNETIKSFAAATDKDRKIILERLLGNERYQECLENLIVPSIKEAHLKIAELEATTTRFLAEKNRISEQIKAYQLKHTSFKKDQDIKIATLKAKIVTQVEDNEEEIRSLQLDTQTKEVQLEEMETLAARLPEVENKLYSLAKKLSKIEAKQEILSEKRGYLLNQLEKPDVAKLIEQNCPTCGQVITEDSLGSFRRFIKAQIAEVDSQKVPGLKALSATIRKLKEEKVELRECETCAKKLRDQITRNKKDLATYQIAQERNKQIKIKLKEELKEVQQQLSPYKEIIEKEQENLEKLLKEEELTVEQLLEIKTRVQYLTFFENLFSRTGKQDLPSLPSLKIDNILPDLISGTNRRLHKVDNNIVIDFQSTSKSQNGKVSDKLAVHIENQTGAGNYSGNSGGERKLIDICIMLTLGEIASTRNNRPIPFLFLDGLYDKLDTGNVEKVMDLLHEESLKKESIFVTTLDPNLAALFNNRIVITKQGKVSTLEQ